MLSSGKASDVVRIHFFSQMQNFKTMILLIKNLCLTSNMCISILNAVSDFYFNPYSNVTIQKFTKHLKKKNIHKIKALKPDGRINEH